MTSPMAGDLERDLVPLLTAALITRALLGGAAAGSGLRLDIPGQQAAADRGWPPWRCSARRSTLRQEETRRPADRGE